MVPVAVVHQGMGIAIPAPAVATAMASVRSWNPRWRDTDRQEELVQAGASWDCWCGVVPTTSEGVTIVMSVNRPGWERKGARRAGSSEAETAGFRPIRRGDLRGRAASG